MGRKVNTKINNNRKTDRTAFNMEEAVLGVAATLAWVVKNEEAKTLDAVVKRTYEWGPNKRKFSPRQMEIAVERLSRNGWIY